jgi:hypothetical protein
MLEAGISLTVGGALLGWSGSTMVLMAKRYGHIGTQAKHDAVAVLDQRSRSSSQNGRASQCRVIQSNAPTPNQPSTDITSSRRGYLCAEGGQKGDFARPETSAFSEKVRVSYSL